MSTIHFDVAVLGLGALGSAAAYHAAIKGANVIGFERFDFGNVHGSSHDTSRIVRTLYGAPEVYMLTITGGVVFFSKPEESTGQAKSLDTNEFEKSTSAAEFTRSLDANGIPYELLDPEEVNKRWPEFNIPKGVKTVCTADSGIVHASRSVMAMQYQARVHGAVLKEKTRVDRITPDGSGVAIETSQGPFHAAKVILTANLWINNLLTPLGAKIPPTVMQEQVTYFKPTYISPFHKTKFPVWIWAGDKYFYGFPSYGSQPSRQALLDELTSFVDGLIPAKGQTLRMVTFQYAITLNRQFIISPLKRHKNIIVGLGGGHAFKFAPAIGRVMAKLAIEGTTTEDISTFRIPNTGLKSKL
ncbi:hypothetical protein QQZ08_005114 [Neonectria magnoliae]|uniref:FAD dependent oxidoreductase domain-containing protein n=1 Tax=Neonectria magnoliae TaxID=2732573 RepID=A0ABR1I649_9HYPO